MAHLFPFTLSHVCFEPVSPQGYALVRPTDTAGSPLLWGSAMGSTPTWLRRFNSCLKSQCRPQRTYRNSNTRTRGENGRSHRSSEHSAGKAVKWLAFHQGSSRPRRLTWSAQLLLLGIHSQKPGPQGKNCRMDHTSHALKIR